MAKKQASNKLFDDIATAAPGEPTERRRSTGFLDQRDSQLSDLASGAIEDKTHRWVNPARCRMWSRHNRRYDLLNQSRCQDLIDGFKSQGRQEFPAIVRKVQGDAGYDYEVICGARRHWTVTWLRENNYPDFRYLIEVRDLTDEQAFRLSDIENRDNLDLSDYERAVDYKDALERYYKNQKEMADRLEVSEGWLSRYLDLAAMPTEVVAAFGDVTELKTKHGRDLKPHLRSTRGRGKVITSAKAVSAEQQERIAQGRAVLSGANVVRALVKDSAPKKTASRGTLAEYKCKQGPIMLSATRQGRSGLVLRVVPDSGATQKELIETCGRAIRDFA